MHELTMAAALVELGEEEAIRHGVPRITRLRVRAGVFRQVNPDLLKEAFAQVRCGRLAHAELEVEIAMPSVRCRRCGTEDAFSSFAAHCRTCGSGDVEVRGGDELMLTGIDFDTDDESALCAIGGGCHHDRSY